MGFLILASRDVETPVTKAIGPVDSVTVNSLIAVNGVGIDQPELLFAAGDEICLVPEPRNTEVPWENRHMEQPARRKCR